MLCIGLHIIVTVVSALLNMFTVSHILSSVSSASTLTCPGLTRHEFGQQNSLKVPIIKFHKNVSTRSRIVPCKWADGPVGTFCDYFGNISGSVTFLHLIDALFCLEFIVCIV